MVTDDSFYSPLGSTVLFQFCCIIQLETKSVKWRLMFQLLMMPARDCLLQYCNSKRVNYKVSNKSTTNKLLRLTHKAFTPDE